MQDPRLLNELLYKAYRMSGFGQTAQRRRNEEAARVARLLPAGDFNWGEYDDLWWTFCEDVADRLREDYPHLAHRLYELADESYVKEGTQATGSGEGIISVRNQERVRDKRESLPRSQI